MKKVHQDFTDILLTRIYLSREIKVFSFSEIAEHWHLSQKTLTRYERPELREYSRFISKRATEAYKSLDKTLCQICGKPLRKHERCKSCTILIHDVPECSCERVALSTKIILK